MKQFDTKDLELMAIALRSKVRQTSHYDKGTCGAGMNKLYCDLLSKVEATLS